MKTLPRGSADKRAILPKNQAVLTTPHSSAKPKPAEVTIPVIRNGAGFRDSQDSVCFHLYLSETAKEISGAFPTSLWGRLIPQISEMEPFVRHAVIAIGALSKHSRTASWQGNGLHAPDYQYALTQYGKSVRGMRQAIANGQHDLRKALIACLLVFTFEGMLGNQASASLHAESGLKLLHERSTRKDYPNIKPWTTQKASTEHLFEGDLLEAYTSLDSQVLIFMDHRSGDVHEEVKIGHTRLIESMPPDFYNLYFARQFWKLILNRNYHFSKHIQATVTQKAKEAEPRLRLDDPWEDSAKMDKDELLGSQTASTSLSMHEEHLKYQADISRWLLACKRLFAEIEAGDNESEKVGAAILKVQTMMSYMMLAGTFFTTETEYDIFLPKFKAIVELSEIILPFLLSSYHGTTPRFNFDVGIVAALFFVASRCRVDGVRIRAMDMLFEANYREGIWDAAAVAHMARWLRDMEREGLGKEDIVLEEKRCVLSAVNIDLFNKRALLGASQGGRGSGVVRKTMLSW